MIACTWSSRSWAAAASVWLIACGESHDAPAPSMTAAPSASTAAAARSESSADARAFEAALLRIERCELGASGKIPDCPAKAEIDAMARRISTDGSAMGAVALRHLRHPSPAVRYAAAGPAAEGAFHQTHTPLGPELVALYAAALEQETDALVLRNLLDQSLLGAPRDPKILAVIVRSVSHADARVRSTAIALLGTSRIRPLVADVTDRVVAALDDADESVRAQACATVGLLDEPKRALPLLKTRLADEKVSVELRSACFVGLVRSWVGRHEPLHPSAEAYTLTLTLLNAGKRSHEWPPFHAIYELIGEKPARQKPGPDGKTWSERVKGFYDQKKLVEALEAVALDEEANDGCREGAITVIAHLEERDRLVGLAMTLRKSPGAQSTTLADKAAAAARALK